ncbi:MAG: CHAP domain-containing protein [bacterium]|nr:CHAP domain-containing protein [bacterium]
MRSGWCDGTSGRKQQRSEVDEYLTSVGLDGGYSWCAAYVYWVYDKAYKELGKKNPLHKTAGVLNHWNNSTAKKILSKDAAANPSLVKPGQIFIMAYGGGLGHTGIVEKVNGGFLTTIEGNTNDGGSREGIGVFRRTGRKIKDINKGFLQY